MQMEHILANEKGDINENSYRFSMAQRSSRNNFDFISTRNILMIQFIALSIILAVGIFFSGDEFCL